MPRMTRYFTLVVSMLAASTAAALNVSLTPETPLSVAVPAPAPFEQRLESVASEGSDFLAVWIDRRSTIPSLPSFQTAAPLYVARLNSIGRPTPPAGRKLLDNVLNAFLITSPSGYVLLWSGIEDGVYWMRLDDSGLPTSAPARLTDGYITGAATSVGTLLVLHGGFSQAQTATVFTFDGTVVSNTPIPSPTALPLGFSGNRYGVIYDVAQCNGVSPCTYTQVLTSIAATGASSTTNLAQATPRGPYTKTAATVENDRILIAWVIDSATGPARTVSYQLLNFNGDPLTPETLIDTTNTVASISGAYAPSVGWDGHEFLVAYQWPTSSDERLGQIRTVRITAGGAPIDKKPQILWSALGSAPLFATSNSGVLIGWDTTITPSSDVIVRVATSFDLLDVAFTSIIPQTAALQSEVRVAAIGANNLAAWREGDLSGAIVASSSVAGRIVVDSLFNSDDATPAIGASNDTYLIAWRQQDVVTPANNPQRILAKRVRANGQVIETDPIFVSLDSDKTPFYAPGSNTVAVASDGKDFLVAWATGSGAVDAARISATGLLLDATPINVSGSTPGTAGSLRIVYSGGAYVIAWSSDQSCHLCLLPPPIGGYRYPIYVARVTTTGTIATKAEQVVPDAYGLPIGLAHNSSGLLLVWTSVVDTTNTNICVNAMPLTPNGKPDGAVQSVECNVSGNQQSVDLDAAWDGGSYVVAWTDQAAGHPVAKAERVAASGSPLDDGPFPISDAAIASFGPALASSPDGVLIAYERLSTDQFDGVAHAFLRKVLRAQIPPRRRAVK